MKIYIIREQLSVWHSGSIMSHLTKLLYIKPS